MKKKLLFTTISMGLGGIETSLISLLNNIDYTKYDVTLILRNKKGEFLSRIPKQVEIIDFNYKEGGLFNKILNRIKLNYFVLKYKNKFHFSACYAPYCYNSAYLARKICANSNFWVHGDYISLYNGDKDAVIKFFENKGINKFKRVVFVSNRALKNTCKILPNIKDKSFVCNNIINEKEILEKYNQSISNEIIRENDETIFLNVGRHDEKEKSLSRIIGAAKKLKEENYNFKIYFIGDGKDHTMYVDLVKKYGLDNECVFKGFKKNPYPYFKNVDVHILCSNSEGLPTTILESILLNVDTISTDVSDVKKIIKDENKIIDKSVEGVYKGMKYYIENKNTIKKENIDFKEYNNKILKFIDEIIEEK